MFNIDEEKDKLTQNLSEQYSHNIISMEEYERILEYINKIETKKEVSIIEKIIRENNVANNEAAIIQNNEIKIAKIKEKHLSMFSWRTTNVESINGNAGKFISLFGTNRIIVTNLPKGRTVINVNSVFGLTEIIVSKNIKIINKAVPVFSGIFSPNETNGKNEELPELYITGKAIFGNITVKAIDEVKKEKEQDKAFEEKVKEKILKKIYDKM
ncbi:MAG: hypothetical protein LBL31_01295 [Spirochaetaceae bacterium]|jgi:hypothetical protein|nr:hypothetical protein [Spirochaetaceae bacterium]